MNITSTKQGRKTLTYKNPVINRTAIGSKPSHHFDQNSSPTESYVKVVGDPFQDSGRTVWADIPEKNGDGSPYLVDKTETLDLRPRSPWVYGGVSGGVGALAGAGLGALLSSTAGVSPGIGAAVGAAAVGGIAGAAGAYHVYGEKTKLVWDQHDIIDHQMVGYKELVGPGEKGGRSGYFHRYVPDIESTKIGSFETPRVLRYKGDVAPEEGSQKLKPTEPDKIPTEPGEGLDVVVEHEDERLQSRRLGSIPHDYWSYSAFGSGYTSCGSSGCDIGGRSIYRNTPVYEPDGEPRVDHVTRRVQASPYSVPLFAAGGFAAGGALGAGVGALAAHLTGLPVPVTAGVVAGVGGIAAAIGAGNYAAGDAVRLEWREYGIHEKRLAGYTEHVTPHYETRCETHTDSEGNSKTECETYQDGWDHSFTPDVRSWEVGTYVGPKVVHYQKTSDGFERKEEKQTEEQAGPGN